MLRIWLKLAHRPSLFKVSTFEINGGQGNTYNLFSPKSHRPTLIAKYFEVCSHYFMCDHEVLLKKLKTKQKKNLICNSRSFTISRISTLLLLRKLCPGINVQANMYIC